MCVVRVDLKTDGLHSEGMGAWEETYTTKGKTSIFLSFRSEMLSEAFQDALSCGKPG